MEGSSPGPPSSAWVAVAIWQVLPVCPQCDMPIGPAPSSPPLAGSFIRPHFAERDLTLRAEGAVWYPRGQIWATDVFCLGPADVTVYYSQHLNTEEILQTEISGFLELKGLLTLNLPTQRQELAGSESQPPPSGGACASLTPQP